MIYTLHLQGGSTHTGDDERDIEVLVEAIALNAEVDDLPADWGWYAGLYVKRDAIVGVARKEV